MFISREIVLLSDSSDQSDGDKKRPAKKRRRKHKDTTLEVPIAENKYVIPISSSVLHSLIRCICGSISWDAILLACVYCGAINHGSCYNILSRLDNIHHVCGYCSVMNNVDCTDDSVKSIYSVTDLSSADWTHIENEFLYKKAAISYLMKEHLGFLGVDAPNELFLQTRFNVVKDLAYKTIGRLCTKNLVSFTDNGIEVNRSKINEEFGLYQKHVPDPVSYTDVSDYRSSSSLQTAEDRSRNDSGYSTSSTTSVDNIGLPGEQLVPLNKTNTPDHQIIISDVHSLANDSGLGNLSVSINDTEDHFLPPDDDNSRYNAARTIGPLADILVSKKVFEKDGIRVRKYLRVPSNHPSLYNGPEAVSRKPDPVYRLEVGVSSIPLYGKLTHMLQAQPNSGGGGGFNCQLLLSMHDHGVSCRVWGGSPEALRKFQEPLRIGYYYLVKFYAVNAKTYGRALPHTTLASLSLQCYHPLIPLELVHTPIGVSTGAGSIPSTPHPAPDYDPQAVFAPGFAPVVQGSRAAKKQTEPTYRSKLSRMGSNLTSVKQVFDSHFSGNLPPPPPPTGARQVPPLAVADLHPTKQITTGIVSRDTPSSSFSSSSRSTAAPLPTTSR